MNEPTSTRRSFLAGAAGAALLPATFGAVGVEPAESSQATLAGRLAALPRAAVRVDAAKTLGPLDWWRHAVGQGGISPAPLPKRVREGIRKLQPRLFRIFVQEFFRVYPDHERFDWSRLDPYMDALAQTGAKVVAAITIKPKPLYPTIDQRIWRPVDVAEWQNVVHEMVRRYSVRKPIVSHWEILNEPDIGEDGGTPHLIREAEDYTEFYRMTIAPILRAFPQAKVGGPAVTWAGGIPLPGFVDRCLRDGTQLDFVSWHRYDDVPENHAIGVEQTRTRLAAFPADRRPEMMVTEWSKSFDAVSTEELAFDPSRAAIIASSLLAMIDAKLDWSFFYHAWDQVVDPDDFRPIFSEPGVANMVKHWNQIPHRFGLFGVDQQVRPQYFVYQMLGRLGEHRVEVNADTQGLRLLAARGGRRVGVMVVNHPGKDARDRVLDLHFAGLTPGPKELVVYRIDSEKRWSPERLELIPVERRATHTEKEFHCQISSPAATVSAVFVETK